LNASNESNTEQKTSKCGCEADDTSQWLHECRIIVMDWLANGRVLVTLVMHELDDKIYDTRMNLESKQKNNVIVEELTALPFVNCRLYIL